MYLFPNLPPYVVLTLSHFAALFLSHDKEWNYHCAMRHPAPLERDYEGRGRGDPSVEFCAPCFRQAESAIGSIKPTATQKAIPTTFLH